jgi:hypothetical protein
LSKVCFPYTLQPKAEPSETKRPYVILELQSVKGEWFKVNALADSGADITSFPRGVSRILGKNFRKGKRVTLVSATGTKLALYLREIKARLGGREFIMTVGFAETDLFPYLLGRKDVLDHFNIKFAKNEVWFLGETKDAHESTER